MEKLTTKRVDRIHSQIKKSSNAIIIVLFLLFSHFMRAQTSVEVQKYSDLFRDSVNICNTSRVDAAWYFYSREYLIGLKKREVFQLLGKGMKLKDFYSDMCGEKHDEQWYYTLWTHCDDDETNNSEVDVYMKLYFYKKRIVCVAIK